MVARVSAAPVNFKTSRRWSKLEFLEFEVWPSAGILSFSKRDIAFSSVNGMTPCYAFCFNYYERQRGVNDWYKPGAAKRMASLNAFRNDERRAIAAVRVAEQAIGFIVSDNLKRIGTEVEGAAHAIGSIGQVHQAGGNVTFFDRRV